LRAPPESPSAPLRLTDVLGALPKAELDNLIRRLGVRIDPAKRLDVPAQVARALVQLPDLRDPSRLPPSSIELLHRVAEANGVLFVTAIPAALEPLAARGMVFARGKKGAIELILPTAYLIQLRSWEGEAPRGLRALLAQAPFETASAVAAHYLGRPATPPVSLSLEAAWECLSDPERLAEELGRLAPTERAALEAIEQQGGEVETDELLEIEREPLRMRTAQGPTQTRRGVGFSLERRGVLLPVHPNRHIVPTEIARVIGASKHADRERRRRDLRSFVLGGDHAPRRARFSEDRIPEQAVGVDPLTARLMRWVMQSWSRVEFFNRYLLGTVAPRVQLDLLPALGCAAHVLMTPVRPLRTLGDFVAAGAAMQRLWLAVEAAGMHLQPEMTPVIFRWYVQAGRSLSPHPGMDAAAGALARRFEALADAGPADGFAFFCRVGYSALPHSRSLRKALGSLLVGEGGASDGSGREV